MKWLGVAVVGVTVVALAVWWWVPSQFIPKPDTSPEQAEIQALKQDSTQARAEVARLKQVAKEAEQRSLAWQQRAGAAQAKAEELKAQVLDLMQRRREQRVVSTVEEAWRELQRLGF